MKRTFLVEIEADDDADNARPSDEFFYDVGLGEIPATVVPVEVTAVHAKEREVIDAALTYAKARAEYDADDSSGGDFAMVGMLVDAQGVMELRARELRALMEGKA